MRSCIVLFAVGLFLVLAVQESTGQRQPVGCRPGTKKVENGGRRRCVCSRLAVWECTTGAGRRKRDTEQQQQKCKPGDEWTMDCNKCTCDNDGGAVCTKRLCPDGHKVVNKRATRCKEGTSWKVKCNTCTCRNGRQRCTEKACLN